MENKGKVSIIVAAYNAESFIEDCIKSVLKQTYLNWELIIVNDGSTDSTKEIVTSYVKRNLNIKLINQLNKGAIFARNEGFAHSTGEFVVILDADDIIYNEKLEKQVSYLSSFDENVSLVFGRSHICNENLEVIRDVVVHKPDSGGDYSRKLLETNLFPVHASMFRKGTMKYLHSVDSVTIPDWELWLDLIEFGDFKFHNDFVCAYRHHNKMSAKSDNNEFQITQREGVFNKITSRVSFLNLDNRNKFKIYYTTARAIHKFKGYEKASVYYKQALKYNYLSIKCLIGLILTRFNVDA